MVRDVAKTERAATVLRRERGNLVRSEATWLGQFSPVLRTVTFNHFNEGSNVFHNALEVCDFYLMTFSLLHLN